MGRTEIDLFGIAHVKVEFIPVLKIYTIPILGRFVWSTNFVQCGLCSGKQAVKGLFKKMCLVNNLWIWLYQQNKNVYSISYYYLCFLKGNSFSYFQSKILQKYRAAKANLKFTMNWYSNSKFQISFSGSVCDFWLCLRVKKWLWRLY